MKILSDVGNTDLTKPQISIGWFVGAVIGAVLLIAAFVIAKKVTSIGSSAVSKVPVVGTTTQYLMG